MEDLEVAFDTAKVAAPGHYRPSRTALLLLDFHAIFVEKMGGPDALEALNIAVSLRKWAKSKGVTVIHGVIDTDASPYQTCKEPEKFGAIVATMKAGGVHEPTELVEGGGDTTFVRRPGYVSAMSSPGIHEFLNSKSIKSLLICGLSTSGCVLRTTIPATEAEYVVTVISDACADPKTGMHQLLTEGILNSRAYVMTSAQFREGYEKALDRKQS